tara:strand:- start:10584 stop:11048 length:465 start_codon:yes stop_codon:yes gene_type:complete
MASTITAATMTVTITEAISLNGSTQGNSNTLTIANINEIFKRIVTCPASAETKLLTFNSAVSGAAGALDTEDSKYIRITNKDATNSVEIAVVTGATLYQVTLHAGHSHILGTADDCMLSEADITPSFGTMADLVTISAKPASQTIDIEVFVASV